MMGFGYGMGTWGGLGWIGTLLFLALLVLGIVYLWRALDTGRHHEPHHTSASTTRPSTDPALQILRERYARGEIDKEEFEERRKILGA